MVTLPNEQRFHVEATVVLPVPQSMDSTACAVSGAPVESWGTLPHTLSNTTSALRGPCKKDDGKAHGTGAARAHEPLPALTA